jgi:hypothetical protein
MEVSIPVLPVFFSYDALPKKTDLHQQMFEYNVQNKCFNDVFDNDISGMKLGT